MDLVDRSYINKISSQLEKWGVRQDSPFVGIFRCPICGDSKKSKSKRRGFLVEREGRIFFHCHNGCDSMGFRRFLQTLDPELADEYIKDHALEKIRNRQPLTGQLNNNDPILAPQNKFVPRYNKDTPFYQMKTVSQLPQNHPVKQYVIGRQIPPNHHFNIYYCKKFVQFVKSTFPDKLDDVPEHSRIIFPFIDIDGEVFGYSARSLDPSSSQRYVTIMLNPDKPKIFGLNKVDMSIPYIICEGAVDSLFLSNSIAMIGADFSYKKLNIDTGIVVYDNEPRNKIIVRKMLKAVERGFKVCIWPKEIHQKDINDIVLSGTKNVERIIKDNSYSNIKAELLISQWRIK